jgi:prevent-host-death family protein
MQIVSIAQAKNNFSHLLHAVEAGEDVVLTRHGKHVARIVPEAQPASSGLDQGEVLRQEAQAILRALRAKVKPGPAVDWKAMRDAGRKY